MDLTTAYLGLTLRNPVVASASPMTQDVDGVRRLVDAGVSAVVLPSLFEEQVRREEVSDTMLQEVHEGSFGEAGGHFLFHGHKPGSREGGNDVHVFFRRAERIQLFFYLCEAGFVGQIRLINEHLMGNVLDAEEYLLIPLPQPRLGVHH